MTREDIIRMAREAGMSSLSLIDIGYLEKFAALVAAAEREGVRLAGIAVSTIRPFSVVDYRDTGLRFGHPRKEPSMTPLPFDFHRCAPLRPDAHCRQCLRFDRLPGQTWGERTPVAVGRSGSQDNDCTYVPIRSQA